MCLTDPHSPYLTIRSVISAAYTTIDVTDDNNFAATLKEHVVVNMKTMVQMVCHTHNQWKPVIDLKIPAQYWGIPCPIPKGCYSVQLSVA